MRLLIVGTLNGHISDAIKIAVANGAEVASVDSVKEALTFLRSGKGADLAMVDVALDVVHLLVSMKSERINTPVVACGIEAEPKAAVEAIHAGAQEYVPLPPDAELIGAILAAVSDTRRTLIAEDPVFRDVLKVAERVAASDASILITGESGTGKEMVAQLVHAKSRRSSQKFVSVNCAAIPENLLESELFGHEKGAFTGAVARRIGKFEEANGGTLLLDEISEMDIRLQAKLLRALQEREIDRVGGDNPVKVDIRLIATTNLDLADQVRLGRFREDLLYRLNVMTLKLPALRERPRDIAPLAQHFAAKYAESNGLPARTVSPDGLAALGRHGWPGNVRELENALHRAVLLADGDEIGPDALTLPEGAAPGLGDGAGARDTAGGGRTGPAGTGSRPLVGKTVAEVERDLILDTLTHCFGNRTHAANILGISIRTLRNKLKQYSEDGVPVPIPGERDRSTA
ncbi:MAG: sigma-54 dependent transcriptional regulator [Alphaproteobacteria bacterium]